MEPEIQNAEVIENNKEEVITLPVALLVADLNNRGTITVSMHDLLNSENSVVEFSESHSLEECLSEGTTKLIKSNVDPKKIQVLIGENLTNLMRNSDVEAYKTSITKKLLDMKKKNMDLLSEESCVLDVDTKNSVIKAVSVIDKVIDVISK